MSARGGSDHPGMWHRQGVGEKRAGLSQSPTPLSPFPCRYIGPDFFLFFCWNIGLVVSRCGISRFGQPLACAGVGREADRFAGAGKVIGVLCIFCKFPVDQRAYLWDECFARGFWQIVSATPAAGCARTAGEFARWARVWGISRDHLAASKLPLCGG